MSDLSELQNADQARTKRTLAAQAGSRAIPQGAVLMLGDVVSALLVYLLVDHVLRLIGNTPLDRTYITIWFAIWLLLRAYRGLYPGYGKSPQSELRLHTVSTVQAAITQFAVTFAAHDFIHSRLGLGLLWALLYFTALPVRYLLRALMIRSGTFGRPVVIIGAGKTGALTVEYLLRHPAYGLRPVAAYDDNATLTGTSLHGVPVSGTIRGAVERPITAHAIITIPGARAETQRRIINAVRAAYPITWATPDFFGVPNQALVPHSLGAHASLEVRNNLRSYRSRFTKRLLDVALGTLILLLATPLLLLISIAIRLDSPGPAVYRARRIGRDGCPFDCLKFRTMRNDADAHLEHVLAGNAALRAEYRATHKLKNDPRVTRVGALLRRTSLDELPQLLNVVRGEMSLVGPRPIVHAEIEKYGDTYDTYRLIRPGMTGYWQVNGRSDTSYDERVGMDNFYVTNWSPWLDIIILIQTARVVLMGRGAY